MCLHSWIFSFSLISFLHVSRLFTNVFPSAFFFSFMHFIFQVWILKSLIVTKYCEILPESFVCCGIINIRRKRGFWNKNIFLNIILQLYLIKDNKNSLKKKNHLSMWMIKLFVPWINVDNIRILAIL